MKSNFLKRILTGFLFAVVVIGSILFDKYIYLAFASLVIILGILEFSRLVKSEGYHLSKTLLVTSSISILLAFFILIEFESFIGLFISVLLNASILISELYKKQKNPFINISYSVFAQIYIALPFALLIYLLSLPGYFYPYLALSIFILIWTNDTFAYIFGSTLGKNKLFERISPKKSWEGAIGGGASSIVVAYILSTYLPIISTIDWIIVGLLIAVFSNFGDLIQSLYKRSINIKDSGNILPGHGGILDRFDSFIFASPIVVLYIKTIYL
ncbi:MAG: phosphatidate cytidylyltransferase [Bacteroidales bacterium]|nr:phosphatidate cytidylyltransferase [Bacteroidales bacterium]